MPTTPPQSLDSSPLWTTADPLAPLPPLPPDFFGTDPAPFCGPAETTLDLNHVHDDSPPVSIPAVGAVSPNPRTPPPSPEACPFPTNRGSRCDEAFSDPFTLARHIVAKHMRHDSALPLNSSAAIIDRWLTDNGITDRSVRGSAKRRFLRLKLWECSACGKSFGREEALKEHETTLTGRCAQRKRAAKRRRAGSALAQIADSSSSSASSSTSPLPFSPNLGGSVGGDVLSGQPLLFTPPPPATTPFALVPPFHPQFGGAMSFGPFAPLQFPLMSGMLPDGSWSENDFAAYRALLPDAYDLGLLTENGVDAPTFAFPSGSPGSSA